MNWDLTSYFPSFEGPETRQFKTALEDDVEVLRQRTAALAPLDEANADAWEEVVIGREDLDRRWSHLTSYIGALSAADAHNEEYAREEAALALLDAEFEKLNVELLRGFRDPQEGVFAAFCARPALADCGHFLRRLREEAGWTMPADQEALAADLGVDGLHAWGRLYESIAGKMEFEMEYPDGRREQVPMAQRRALMQNPDRRVRQAAFERGNWAWQRMEDVTAAALNAIAGTRLTLNRRRGVEHFLDRALFQAGITRQTLDAMFTAIFDQIDVGRDILALKAGAIGEDGIAWYDLEAPLPLAGERPSIPWEEGSGMVAAAFSKAYPALGEFTRTMYAKRWIEFEPRAGKRPGAFCTGSLLTAESRIYMTYNDTIGDVRTLAHEAGHAFHSHVIRNLRPWAQDYPMTLAESASTFAEMILTDGLLADPSVSVADKLRVLDMETGHAAVYLLDIPIRYEFESAFHEEREAGEVSARRLKELMAQTQRRVFGPLLADGGEDPLFWASKMHFYFTGISFYNFPYTFGYLLSRGLYGLFKQEGEAFIERYEDFLCWTGSDTAEGVARRTLGCDLESPDFWSEAIQSLAAPFAQLKALLVERSTDH